MGSKRLSYMSLHFFPFSFFSRLLILARFGQVEDGAHSLFSSSLSYPTLLSFRRDNCRLFHLMNWKTFFFTIDRDTERGGSGLFLCFCSFAQRACYNFEGRTTKLGQLLSSVWLGDEIPPQSRQSRLGFRAVVTSPRRFCLGYIRLDCVWMVQCVVYLPR